MSEQFDIMCDCEQDLGEQCDVCRPARDVSPATAPEPQPAPDKAPPREWVTALWIHRQLEETTITSDELFVEWRKYDAVVAEKQRHYEVALAQATRADQLVKERDELRHQDKLNAIAFRDLAAQLAEAKQKAEVYDKRFQLMFKDRQLCEGSNQELIVRVGRLERALAEAQENSVYKARVIRDAATRIERLERAIDYAKNAVDERYVEAHIKEIERLERGDE